MKDKEISLLDPIRKLTIVEKRALKSGEIQVVAHNELAATFTSLIGYVDPKGGKGTSPKGMMMPLSNKIKKAIGDRNLLADPQKMMLAAMFLAISEYSNTSMKNFELYQSIKAGIWRITDQYLMAIKSVTL